MHSPVLAQLLQVDPETVRTFCRPEAGARSNIFCRAVYSATGVDWLGGAAGFLIPLVFEVAVIIAAAYLADRFAKRGIGRFVRKVQSEGIAKIEALRQRAPLAHTGPINLARATMRTETIGGVLRSVATTLIAGIAAVLVLGAVGINLGPLVAGAGIVGVALGFGAQNLVKDYLAGIFILLEDQYGIGDIVSVGEENNPSASGTVEGVTLRITRLRDIYGTVWYVPNGDIRVLGNKSQLWARSLIDIGVAYDTDVAHASAVIKQVADSVWQDPSWERQVLEEPEVWGVESFGPSEVVIRLVVKVEPARQWRVNRELRARLLTAFDREGIEIPFPQRTVWMRDASAAGGDKQAPATATAAATTRDDGRSP